MPLTWTETNAGNPSIEDGSQGEDIIILGTSAKDGIESWAKIFPERKTFFFHSIPTNDAMSNPGVVAMRVDNEYLSISCGVCKRIKHRPLVSGISTPNASALIRTLFSHDRMLRDWRQNMADGPGSKLANRLLGRGPQKRERTLP